MLFLAFTCNHTRAQERLTSILVATEHKQMFLEDGNQLNSIWNSAFHFFSADYNVISYQNKNIYVGLHLVSEEDLPADELSVTDFFIYNFGVNYSLKNFGISFIIENFLSITDSNLTIEPANYATNFTTHVYLEHDTPSLMNLSITYNF